MHESVTFILVCTFHTYLMSLTAGLLV